MLNQAPFLDKQSNRVIINNRDRIKKEFEYPDKA